ncbi:MAG: sigma-54 dependent transcriptional regulator [Syntrophales bacterium]|jgi:DNA-binding NtrC family response regulator|nr:sigma-54 dependent transcriptional regulator [Syntrophales bacterium]MCK9527633.1 sigma-54 dependent transcriptional regulator [Syntrophales bacterium]MDX9922250.1 sigma-54 dependent transcriptional regulator [Syntrophales bacterium]
MKSFLVLADQDAYQQIAASFRSRPQTRIDHASDQAAALHLLQRHRHDLVFIDLDMLRKSSPDGNYKGAMQLYWVAYPDIEIIVMAPQAMIREAVLVVKEGASNYLTYPLNTDEVKYVTESLYESIIVQSTLDYMQSQFWEGDALELIQTRSPAVMKLLDKVRSVAVTNSTVLISGETGTGKGVLAKLIHRHSNRKKGQFISVHCGAIPESLLESELFGHERGAFTGAVRRQMGKFEIAHGGTVFLDEIGTISLAAQIRLLQVLQDGIFSRVGGEEALEADVRVIAATNIDLRKLINEGQFRRDLYYRLNVFPIEMPPLRDRREDIPLLVSFFLKKLNKFSTKVIHDVHPDVLAAFQEYSWPGNIRELQNLIERAHIIETSPVLTPESFPGELFDTDGPSPTFTVDTFTTLADTRRRAVEAVEKRYLQDLLTEEGGSIKETARRAGITTRQISKLMKRHGFRKEYFKPPGTGPRPSGKNP